MRLNWLIRLDRNASRLREIVTTLAKYGIADWLANLDYDFLQNWLTSADGQKLGPLTTGARIRLALTELGTTFIKIGQILSTRYDLIGPELAEELRHLQSNTPPDPPNLVRATIEAELGQPITELFAEFADEALASASIGQVHRARLKNGQEVVVKVQHAGIPERVTTDLDLLSGLAQLAQQHVSQLRPYQPVALSRDFRRLLLRELDFAHERRNLEQLAQNFADEEMIHFPQVYPQLCSRRVLTMEMLHGIKGNDYEGLRKAGVDLTEFTRRAAHMYLDMIFRDGFYHADPHPGNYMLLPGGVLGLLDFGMVGRIDEQLREDIENLLLAVVDRDTRELADVVMRLGAVPTGLDADALRAELADFVAEYSTQSLQEFDLSGALQEMTSIIRRYHILLPSSCALLLKTLIMLEGTARYLNPDFSLAELLQPYYRQAIHRRYSPRRLFGKVQRSYRDWERFLEALPRDLSDILERTRKGTFEIKHEHQRLEVSVNRLVVGILSASLFLGSTLLLTQTSPQLPDLVVTTLGVLSFALSGVLGFHLLRSIRKSEKEQ